MKSYNYYPVTITSTPTLLNRHSASPTSMTIATLDGCFSPSLSEKLLSIDAVNTETPKSQSAEKRLQNAQGWTAHLYHTSPPKTAASLGRWQGKSIRGRGGGWLQRTLPLPCSRMAACKNPWCCNSVLEICATSSHTEFQHGEDSVYEVSPLS